MEEDIGESRLGPRSILANFGPTLLLGSFAFIGLILLIIVIILVFKKLASTEKGRQRIKWLKQKVFYNPIIRYLILNCLKLNVAAILVLTAP